MESNNKLLNDLTDEQQQKIKEKLQERVAMNVQKVQASSGFTATSSLNIRGGEDKEKATTKRVGVKIRPSDSLGAAALPEGYMAKKRAETGTNQGATTKAPLSYHERARIAQESRPYTAPKEKSTKKILRAGGGEIWEDPTLAHWDNDDYRLFAGDLGNEVTEELLTKAFAHYPSLIRCHVVREKRTNKSKGYGFVSFKDPDDYVKAMREMNGKYVGNRPISLKRSSFKEHMATKESIKQQKALAAFKGAK